MCGDRSLGFNFNVLSCESCKAFFRRNALSSKKLTCPFSNGCEITVITRRFCQKCRLEKCFKMGMKKEYIMSEEDKELKRMKIEQNRNKRKLKTDSGDDDGLKFENKVIIKKVKEEKSPSLPSTSNTSDDSDDQGLMSEDNHINLTADSSISDIVKAIIENPKDNSVIQQVMRTQEEALSVMSRIISDPNLALLIISHLIKHPEIGMLIISKILSKSPLDALSVFTQFMSSPLDALQIIFKVISSPKEVLIFLTELTKSPHNAIEIMRNFLGATTENLQHIGKIMTSSNDNENEMIKSMLDVSSLDSPKSMISSPSTTNLNSPLSTYNDSDSNNNDYQQMTSTILKEIAYDLSGKRTYKVNSIDSIINEAIKLEYNTPEMITQMQNPCRELNEIELLKIQELLDSNKALYIPIEEDLTFLGLGSDSATKTDTGNFMDPILLKVINLTSIAIRRLIKMSKKISVFKRMCQEDQIALLKVKLDTFNQILIKDYGVVHK